MIKIERGKKSYHTDTIQTTALNDVSLYIKSGEFVSIMGPSGCGKSTLMNIIGLLDKPCEGDIYIDNQKIESYRDKSIAPIRNEKIGFVFQAYNLIPVLTAAENIEFIMLLQHRDKAERTARVKELMTKMGIGNEMNKMPSEISGGQQQRVAVARALASKPAFVLADEPTANLDSVATADLLDIMHQMNQEEGVTFIFSTHDQRVIDRAKRVITLVDGQITKDEIQA